VQAASTVNSTVLTKTQIISVCIWHGTSCVIQKT